MHSLLLFPLVENAFKYVGGEYRIIIGAWLENNNILIFNVINSIDSLSLSQKEEGIGLENLRKRLNLLYPDKHTLQLTKAKDSFYAKLTIALENED